MGKRYGRNQKRRHREEITRLNQECAKKDRTSRHLNNNLRRARSVIHKMTEIIESVSAFSVALPPKVVNGRTPVDKYSVIKAPTVEGLSVAAGNTPCHTSYEPIEKIDLYALRLFLESKIETFQAAIHLEYASGQQSAYMVSRKGLMSMPKEVLVNRFASEIGRVLINYLQKN